MLFRMKNVGWVTCSATAVLLEAAIFFPAMKAYAQDEVCVFCNSSVLITEGRAKCFKDIYEERTSRLIASGRGFVEVNLEGCSGSVPSRTKDPNSVLPGADVTDAVVYLDGQSMECLIKVIDSVGEPIKIEQPLRIYFEEDCSL